jgi:hypothetical protein
VENNYMLKTIQQFVKMARFARPGFVCIQIKDTSGTSLMPPYEKLK